MMHNYKFFKRNIKVKKGEKMIKFNQLNKQQQGFLLIGVGCGLLLLHMYGIIEQSINLIVMVSSIAMIIFGLIKLEALQKAMTWFKSLSKKKK
jgi:cytochrome c biogenesis protein CcdA